MAETTTATKPTHPTITEFYRDSTIPTMGEQYKNLGNIEQGTSGMWLGQAGIGWNQSGTTAFKVFASYADGAAAQAFLLERYVIRNGDQSFNDIIKRYAPPSENNTAQYVAQVTSNVDKIARSLGYNGPTINNGTDLKEAFGDKSKSPNGHANGDIVLAATVKAMNEVEVGRASSDRLNPAGNVLAAVENKYRKQYGSYEGYARSIGQDPGVRAPSRHHTVGTFRDNADTEQGAWHDVNDQDLDKVMNGMFGEFFTVLLQFFAMLFGGHKADQAPQQGAPVSPAQDPSSQRLPVPNHRPAQPPVPTHP